MPGPASGRPVPFLLLQSRAPNASSDYSRGPPSVSLPRVPLEGTPAVPPQARPKRSGVVLRSTRRGDPQKGAPGFELFKGSFPFGFFKNVPPKVLPCPLPFLAIGFRAWDEGGERQTPPGCPAGFAKFQGATQSSRLVAVEAGAVPGGLPLGPLRPSVPKQPGQPSGQEASRPPAHVHLAPPHHPRTVSGAGAGKSRSCCSFSSEPPIRSLPGDISLERTASSSSSSLVPNVNQTGRQCSWKRGRLMERGLGTQGHGHFYWGAKSAPWRGGGGSFPGLSLQGQRCFSFSFRMASSLALVAAAVLRGNPSSSRPLAMLPPDFPEVFAWKGRQHRSRGLPVRRRAGGLEAVPLLRRPYPVSDKCLSNVQQSIGRKASRGRRILDPSR